MTPAWRGKLVKCADAKRDPCGRANSGVVIALGRGNDMRAKEWKEAVEILVGELADGGGTISGFEALAAAHQRGRARARCTAASAACPWRSTCSI